MEKDFDTWNKNKKQIEVTPLGRFHFHEREVWWCSIGLNIGDEEDGKNTFFERPVLVVRKFNNGLAWVVPTSTKLKEGPFYHAFSYNNGLYSGLLSQIRLISVKRFRKRIGRVSGYQFALVKAKLILLLG